MAKLKLILLFIIAGVLAASAPRSRSASSGEPKKGRTAAQIRKGIVAGDWRQVDLQTAASIN